jgi:hypothetical protein
LQRTSSQRGASFSVGDCSLNSHFYQFVICFTTGLKKNQRPALTLVAMIAKLNDQLNTNTTYLANFPGGTACDLRQFELIVDCVFM